MRHWWARHGLRLRLDMNNAPAFTGLFMTGWVPHCMVTQALRCGDHRSQTTPSLSQFWALGSIDFGMPRPEFLLPCSRVSPAWWPIMGATKEVAAIPDGHGGFWFDLNQSQGGMYICAVMKISLVAPVKFFIGTWKAIRLCPLATTICAFHLGFSLVPDLLVHAQGGADVMAGAFGLGAVVLQRRVDSACRAIRRNWWPAPSPKF